MYSKVVILTTSCLERCKKNLGFKNCPIFFSCSGLILFHIQDLNNPSEMACNYISIEHLEKNCSVLEGTFYPAISLLEIVRDIMPTPQRWEGNYAYL